MKYIVAITLFFHLQYAQAQEVNISQIRELYIEASFEEDAANELFELTKSSTLESDHLIFSYHAISQMLLSKFAFNPLLKLSSFNKGKDKLENAIKLNPNDLELRFLRFCAQDGTPEFLGYKSNMQEDYELIQQTISTHSKELQDFIIPIFKTLNDGRTSHTG